MVQIIHYTSVRFNKESPRPVNAPFGTQRLHHLRSYEHITGYYFAIIIMVNEVSLSTA